MQMYRILYQGRLFKGLRAENLGRGGCSSDENRSTVVYCAMRCLLPLIYIYYTVFGPFQLFQLAFATPRFDPSAFMQEVLVPADAAVGSIIYRLRATDPTFDYPLVFTLQGKSSTVSIDSLNCTRFNSVCQANVVVKKRLESGRFYDFTVQVVSVRGESASLKCSFRATNATTPINDIFPGAPTLITISEKARRNTELGTIRAIGHPLKKKPVLMELWGSPQFGLHQKVVNERDAEATILLLRPLDYETTTVHHLTILANDPYSEIDKDTRNIAGWSLLVAVTDEQDTPPIFSLAPPTTTLSPTLVPGDVVLKVHAEDGDRGNPREIRYGLITEGNPFAPFFNISDETGELRLTRPLSDLQSLSRSGQPILLTVQAEEVRSNPQEAPSQSSTVVLALIPPGIQAGVPTFGATEYTTLLDENSPTGTVLDLPQAEIITQPSDVVSLELQNNNGTFDVTPSVVEGHADFQIRVHDPKLLDYEARKSVVCYIVAKEVGTGNYTAKAKLTVLLNDVNDNVPEFTENEYHASVQENAVVGTTVLRVEATDIDREPGSKIRYTHLNGQGSQLFNLDPELGIITVTNSLGLDAENTPTLQLTVEAADENGMGKTATSLITINLIDINDEEPIFDKKMYEFILNPDKNGFTADAFIKASDKDISPPNNEIHYELIDKIDNLVLNEFTGELTVIDTWTSSDIITIRARAWDGGVPRMSSECEIRIYPPEGADRRIVVLVPGHNPDRNTVATILREVAGGKVTIDEVRPYSGYEPGLANKYNNDGTEKSVVVATVANSKNSVIDVQRLQARLDEEYGVRRHEETRIEKAGAGGGTPSLLWLIILLIILALIIAIILILCCICAPCPLYVPPKRRKTASAEMHEKLVVKGSGQGVESKSVQVAEWFGRREAWTPDQAITIDNEAESLRRHELERGSDKDGIKRQMHRQAQIQREPSRDQLYIREGNTDILRLITRGNEPQQIPVTLVAEPTYMATDSGKDILMRRYIDQQQQEAARTQHILLPNAVSKLQQEHELLEASLRQQNAVLRQILMERERDLRLETQSLPAGTQTDQDAYTQTEPEFLHSRKVRSDNDASDASDEEIAIIKARIKQRRAQKLYKRGHVKRQIKTPIQEETELEIIEKPQKSRSSEKPKVMIKQTKTSEMRQRRAASEGRSRSTSSRSAIRKEVLREISASLEHSDLSNSDENLEKTYKDEGQQMVEFSDDSLEEISPRSEKTTDSSKYKTSDSSKYKTSDSGKYKYHSESDLQEASVKSILKETVKSQSHADLTKDKSSSKPKRVSRYMEWYNKNNKQPNGEVVKKKKRPVKKELKVEKKNEVQSEKDAVLKEATTKLEASYLQDTESSSRKKAESRKNSLGPDHPLLQHSEYRYEAPYTTKVVTTKRPEEDTDSGIALARPPMAQKKSVFTIAYDDMHTSQLRPDSTTPPY